MPNVVSCCRRLWPWMAVLLVLCAWDRAAWLHLSPRDDARAAQYESFPMIEQSDDARGGTTGRTKAASMRNWETKHRIEGRPWYMLLYVFGRYEPWLILAAWLIFSRIGMEESKRSAMESGEVDVDVLQRGMRQALTLTASILVAGVSAEILKGLVRRVRPEFTDGWFAFVAMWETTPAGVSFGMPSSHAAVAFAAAIAVGRMMPSTRWVLYPLAAGCALSRVYVGAHYLSDVYIGVVLGVLGERAVDAGARALWGSPVQTKPENVEQRR